MKHTIRIIFFLLIVFSTSLKAQPRGFSSDPLKFISELEAYFRDAKAEDDSRKALSEFRKIYEGGFYSDDQKKMIIATANKMAERKMKADSEYKDYFKTLIVLNKAKPEYFDQVHEAFGKLLLKRNREAASYLSFTSEFFNGQTLNLSKSVKWFLPEDNYRMEFDSVPKIVVIGKTDLSSEARGDRSVIYGTEGVYYPLSKQWKGKGGKVYWTRGGLDSTVVFAELSKYIVDCSKSDYTADSVLFYHRELFAKPLLGQVVDRLTTNNKPETATYPKFDSYLKEYAIKDFFKNVDYYGGFSMAGNKLYGVGSDDEKASIKIYINNTLALRTYSNSYILRSNNIVSFPAEITIYLDQDSIYHPGIEFRFNSEQRKVVLLRKDDGIGNASFSDSYHKMSYEVERMEWDIDKPMIEMGMVKGQFQKESYFESRDFYKEEKFRKVAGIQDVNPLTILKRISVRERSKVIAISSYAKEVRMEEKQVLGLLRSMVEQGFIGMNETKGLIYIKDKTFNYISNEAGNLDYDVIRFGSLAENSINAKLDLKTKELEILGIEKIFLSDSQTVYINPLYGKVRVQENRDMNFAGKVHAGTLDFYGQNFNFNYTNFKIDMPNIDSLKIKVLGKPDKNGYKQLLDLKTVLRDINGILYIDEMNNKSGLKHFPQYPYFQATNESYVFYDYPEIHNSVYRRSDFFFRIDPFMIDSLDDISSTSGLEFPGLMHSGGIFPDFNQILTFQPDTSLGFVTKTPTDGYPFYKGKGKYYNEIRLSNRGFYGTGKIEYLASVSSSNDFLFLLDSTNSPDTRFDLSRQGNNPVVTASGAGFHFEPYEDSLFVRSKKSATDIYAGKNRFDGTICYTPLNLSGNGWSRIKGADLYSKYFLFSPDEFKADESIAKIFAVDTTKLALETGNVQSKIDFIARQGDFKLNVSGAMIKFPFNNYATTLPEFTWFFDRQVMEFRKGTLPAVYSFVSTNITQDSLNFEAEKAVYDLQKTDLVIDGVPKILVADAEILPDKNHVEIYGDAIMRRLEKSVVNANTTTRYHRLYDAGVDVLGRKKYYANAWYDYKTKTDSVGQRIHFIDTRVDSTIQTFAKGTITDSMNFLLNPKVRYKGDVYLKAAQRYLDYDGFVKVNHMSEFIQSQYFRYKGFINPDTVALVLNDPRDENKNRIFTGIHINITNFEAYGTFLSKKIEPNDHDVINVEGKLIYDEHAKIYKVGDDGKLFGKALKGNLLTFDDEKETIYAEGKVDLGVTFGKKLTMQTAGKVTDELTLNKVTADIVNILDFEFLPEATQMLLKTIELYGFDAQGTGDDREVFIRAMAELLTDRELKKMQDDIRLSGTYKLPKTLEKGFVITDVQLRYDQQKRSWRSVGDKVGLAVVGGKQVNKKYKGYYEIVRKRSGNIINLYFELSANDWYFYTFRQNQMEAISSDDEFNKLLISKTKSNSPFSISAMKRKVDFVRSFDNQ